MDAVLARAREAFGDAAVGAVVSLLERPEVWSVCERYESMVRDWDSLIYDRFECLGIGLGSSASDLSKRRYEALCDLIAEHLEHRLSIEGEGVRVERALRNGLLQDAPWLVCGEGVI